MKGMHAPRPSRPWRDVARQSCEQMSQEQNSHEVIALIKRLRLVLIRQQTKLEEEIAKRGRKETGGRMNALLFLIGTKEKPTGALGSTVGLAGEGLS
jgi:hypothetical protein